MVWFFIIDFYCSQLLLGIEIDGNSHDDKEVYDYNRTSILNDYGIKIIRYMNDDVIYNLNWAYEDLILQIEIRIKEIAYIW